MGSCNPGATGSTFPPQRHVEVLHEAASGKRLAAEVFQNTDVSGRTFPAHTQGRVNFPCRFQLGSQGSASLVFTRRDDVARYAEKLDCATRGCKGKAEAGKPCHVCSEKCTAHVEFPDGSRMSLATYFPTLEFDSRDAALLLLLLAAEPPVPGWFSPGAPGRMGDPGRPASSPYPCAANILFHLSKTAGAHHNAKSTALKGYTWAMEFACCMPRRGAGGAAGLCGSRILLLCPAEGADPYSGFFAPAQPPSCDAHGCVLSRCRDA